MINANQALNTAPSNVIIRQNESPQLQMHMRNEIPVPQIVQVVRPLTSQKQNEVFRPVTPINKIQNINSPIGINKEKPRSFSV
jgi:hypothetical protein